jgi:hypothetical protein
MRTVRNLCFVVLMCALAWSAQVAADPITSGPFCDDPKENWVAWAAAGTCAEDQYDDCRDACELCYKLVPKAVELGECIDGTGHYGAECLCHLEEG